MASMDAETTKYLGGDVEHTHLVKGLDYALLVKIRDEEKHRQLEVRVFRRCRRALLFLRFAVVLPYCCHIVLPLCCRCVAIVLQYSVAILFCNFVAIILPVCYHCGTI